METREKVFHYIVWFSLAFVVCNLMWVSSMKDQRLSSEEEQAYEELGLSSSDVKTTTSSWDEEKNELTITQKGKMSVITYDDKKGINQAYSGNPRKIKNVNEFDSK